MSLKDNALVLFALLMIIYAGLIASSHAAAADPLTKDMNFLKEIRNSDYLDWMPPSFQDPTEMTSSDTNYSWAADPTEQSNQLSDALSDFLALLNTIVNYIAYIPKFLTMLILMPVGYFTIFKSIGVPDVLNYPLLAFIGVIHIYTIVRLILDIKGTTGG